MSDPTRPPSARPPSIGAAATTVELTVDGTPVTVDGAGTLLDALRDRLGNDHAKDGCAPQGQCGCCTVLVDGSPRVACVTPVRRVRGRQITTIDGLDDADEWADAFCATGASQCGFCTPGIIVRLAGLAAKKPDLAESGDHESVEQALLAHLCRCTGWRTILDAWDLRHGRGTAPVGRDLVAAARRAELEGGIPQDVAPEVARGDGGFAEDTAPAEAQVAVLDPDGEWTLGESVAAARAAAGKVQGRRTTAEARPPIEIPDGDWDLVLQTSWVEPGYLEPDASWADPTQESSASPLANGGAFGGKTTSEVADVATCLAGETDGPVRALYSREDVVRRGPKRPPLAAGLRRDGSGVVRVAATPGVADAIASALPDVVVEEVAVAGPPTSVELRAAGWAEATALGLALAEPAADGWVGPVEAPGGGTAWARVVDADDEVAIEVRVDAGDVLDEIVLRSYCVGAAHQAASWVTAESLTVDDDGEVHDLTIRSFGILRAIDTPPIDVEVEPSAGEPVAVSDAVFAAVAAAVWIHQDTPPLWPTELPLRPA